MKVCIIGAGTSGVITAKVFKQHGIDVSSITPVDRLAFMGDRAMGALSYKPDDGQRYFADTHGELDLDALATESVRLYEGEIEEAGRDAAHAVPFAARVDH